MKYVVIEGKEYPVAIQGSGKIACVCIGIGTLMQRTLSEQFKRLFTVYSFDLYFGTSDTDAKLENLTMKMIVSHCIAAIQQLNLVKPIILAHSCFGIVAMEIAKLENDNLGGLILVACAPQWNEFSISATNDYFLAHADMERIQNDILRKQHYQKIKSPNDSELSIEKYISDTARYWGDFKISESMIRTLWENIVLNEVVINLFYEKILPSHDLNDGLKKITIPIILLAGEYDYDSTPLMQWEFYPRPTNFTIVNCGQVGHWPNVECASFFDQSIDKWLRNVVFKK